MGREHTLLERQPTTPPKHKPIVETLLILVQQQKNDLINSTISSEF